ncbi:hypothetical protein BB934_25775 [Microvirga ossetica]|uniref:Uncharacterized protein n=1 Tax=Microvirga ossetica TaxID=1882682 RepID=A0A1B2EMI8_9HYPH|nr:hypothetical protein BB934_25775 [Microvirga ossetica]
MPWPTRILDHHLAVRLLGEAEHLRQAEAGSLADALGGEERLEDPVELTNGDAESGVADRYRHVRRRHRPMRANGGHFLGLAAPRS